MVAAIRGADRGTASRPAEIAVLVRMNAQIEPIEAALTEAGLAYQVRGDPLLRPARGQGGDREPPAAGARRDRARAARRGPAAMGRRGRVRGGRCATRRRGARRRSGSRRWRRCSAIITTVARDNPSADVASVIAELDRRAAHERENAGDGVNLLTYHRAKGLEWDAVFLPMLEEGSLPIRQALDDDEALAEERRLLYVGITRARVHLALSWARATRDPRPRRRAASRAGSCSIAPRHRGRVRDLGGPPVPRVRAPAARRRRRPGVRGPPRVARRASPATRACPPYVIAHDSTLAAIAEARPASLSALRRVKGMGPAKLEKYGDGILDVLAGDERHH